MKVCAVFWRQTLGYKYDTIVTKMFNSMSPTKIKPPNDWRGKHTPKHAMTQEYLIAKHIESFHPSISHYRRSHAPLRRYVAPELSIPIMYGYFRESHPHIKCNEANYRRLIKKKNISLCKLGDECDAHLLHECIGGFQWWKFEKQSFNGRTHIKNYRRFVQGV